MTARIFALLALLSLAEAALLSPFIWLLVPAPKGVQPSTLVGLLWLVLMALALQWRWLATRGVRLGVQRGLMGAWLIALFMAAEIQMFGTSPSSLPDVIGMLPGFLAAILLWWRGMALGNSDLQPRTVDLHFQMGALLLIASSLFTLFTRSIEPLPGIAAFFFASLATIPLSNLEYTHRHRYGRRATMTRQWWVWVFGSVIAVMLIGAIATAMLTGRSAADLLVTLISILLLPLLVLLAILPVTFLDWLVTVLRSILDRLGNLANLRPEQPLQPQSPTNTTPVASLSPEANFAIAIVVFLFLAVAIILLMRGARRADVAPTRLTSDLDGKLASSAESVENSGRSRFGMDQLRRWLAVMTIRRLYARATHEAAKRGLARRAAQTPYDFLPELQRAFPTAESDARAITDAYVAAHYGQVPDSQDALNALKVAWERMRSTQRIVKGQTK